MARRRVTFADLKLRSMRGDAYAREARSQGLLRRGRFGFRSRARPGIGVIVGRRGSRRGGFFGSVFKGIKKIASVVTKVPVVSTLAKTALSSIPVVGQVVTAIDRVKRNTVLAKVPSMNFAKLSAAPGPSTPLAAQAASAGMTGSTPAKRKRRHSRSRVAPRKAKRRRGKSTARTRARSGSRSRPRRSSAKQRAARKRFAAAARKGPIKKGTRL